MDVNIYMDNGLTRTYGVRVGAIDLDPWFLIFDHACARYL